MINIQLTIKRLIIVHEMHISRGPLKSELYATFMTLHRLTAYSANHLDTFSLSFFRLEASLGKVSSEDNRPPREQARNDAEESRLRLFVRQSAAITPA